MKIAQFLREVLWPYEVRYEPGPQFPRLRERLFVTCCALQKVGAMMGLF